MVRTKGLEATRRNWEDSHPRVPGAYKAGIQRTTDWQGPALAAENLYKENVIAAANEGRRARGIGEVSNEQWKGRAANIGAANIGKGMSDSKDKYARKMQEVISTIEATELPPRTSDVMSNVTGRVGKLATALHALKTR